MTKKTVCLLTALLAGAFAVGAAAFSPKGASAESSYSEIVMEAESGRVLYENDSDKVMPMASTTKVLTALIIVEDCDLSDVFEIPAEACGIEGSSIYLVAGEKLKISDLLYGLMLRSGNDCAEALAIYHSKSVAAFAEVMNERAKKLGAVHSHFVNPHGLPAENHYTTARDLCTIACAAMRNPSFKEIVSTQKVVVQDGGNGNRVLVNKNKMLYQFDGANGVKTGYTKIAGRCLVSGAERGGMQLVSVVLNCHPMYERSAEILEQCFAKYSLVSLFEPKEMTLPTEVKGKSCRVEAKKGFSYPLAEGELSKVQILFDLPEQVKLPVKCGDALGEMQILLENQLLFSQKIVSIENVKKSFIDILRDIANN